MSRKLSLKELRKAFENGCDLQNIECDWEKLDGVDWSCLLSKQPQFADKCDWKKLKGDDWQKLLEAQPQFAAKYEFYFEDKWILKDQILFLKQEGDSIVVYCKGEHKFDWDLYDGGALITAIEDLRKIIERLPPDEGAKLIDQGITIDTEDFALGITLETELNLEVCNINDNAADDWFDEELEDWLDERI